MSELGFEDLEQILGGYFHQDWMDEFSSEKEAIEYILKNESRRKIVSAKEAIEEVLNKDMSEEEYKDKLFALEMSMNMSSMDIAVESGWSFC